MTATLLDGDDELVEQRIGRVAEPLREGAPARVRQSGVVERRVRLCRHADTIIDNAEIDRLVCRSI